MTNQNKKLAKVLATTFFGVGFVAPLMFSNIAEAADFGTGGIGQWLSDAQLAHTYTSDTNNSSGEYSKWASDRTFVGSNNYSGNLTNANCVVFHGVKFKIVAVDNASAGKDAKVTLWSYETDGTKFYNTTTAEKGVTTDGKIQYNTKGYWGSALNNTLNPDWAYARSDLMKAMDSLYESVFESDTRILQVALNYNDTTTEKNIGGSDLDSKYVWAPGILELGDNNQGYSSGEWQLTKRERAMGVYSWLRWPYSSEPTGARGVNEGGGIADFEYVNGYGILRPALQILNQVPAVFTTNVTIPTNGVLAANGDTGTDVSYVLNNDADQPTFNPVMYGVILDGTKIWITAANSETDGYDTAGLLTTNEGATWDAINTGATGNISYMAKVKNGLDLINVTAGKSYNLKIFGLKTADTAVTELASGTITHLSKGTDGKIHIEIGGTCNNGVAITLKNGAKVDFAGAASNAITTVASDTATLNLGTHTYSGIITNGGTLGVKADAAGGTLASNVSSGTLEITGGLVKYTGNAKIGGTGGTLKIDAGASIDPDAGTLADNTINEGNLYLSGGTLSVNITGTGTTYLTGEPGGTAATVAVNSDVQIAGTLDGSGGTVDMQNSPAGTNTLTIGTLTGTTNLKIDVDMSTFTADKLAVGTISGATVNLAGINITKDIALTSGGTLELPKEEDNKITYVSDNAGTGAVLSGGTYKINDSATGSIEKQSVVTNNYKYTFSKGTTDGTLKYKVEAVDLTFKKFVEGTLGDGTADPATLSLTADLANTGTGSNAITEGTGQSNYVITVNLNGHNLTSASESTIAIKKDKTFNLNGGNTTAGTTDSNTKFNVVSGGALAISGTTIVNGDITNAGNLTTAGATTINGAVTNNDNFTNSGTTTINAELDGSGILTNNGTLYISASNLGNAVTNTNGIFNLGAGELTKVITGGTLNITGNVTSAAGNIAGGTNTIAENKTLTLTDGTLGGTLNGKGKVVVDGIVTSEVDKFNQTGGLEVKDADDILILTAGTLLKDVTNNGTVKLDGATLGGAHVKTGTLEFAKDITTNADYVAAETNKVDSGVTLTLTEGTLAKDVTNSGIVKTEGNIAINGALKGGITGKLLVESGNLVYGNNKDQSITNNVEIKAGATMYSNAGAFGGGTRVSNSSVLVTTGNNLYGSIEGKGGDVLAVTNNLSFAETGAVSQTDSSAIVVPVKVIESWANTAENALFKNVTNANQLDVKNGNLIVLGQVTNGQYYVLAAGTAVANKDLTAVDLWKKENIVLDTSNYFLADYDYVTNGNAIAVKVQAATVQEVNTSGLAAVQQGNITVAKEFTGEVENHLGMIANPKLAEKEKYDKEVWASYIRTKETTEGMKLGAGVEGNNTAQYNGAVVGVDFYSSKKSIAGLAFSYITGDVDSYSGTTATKNDAKYYGVSFYDRVTNGNTALIYDIGYIRGNNDVSQYYNGKPMTSDVKTNTYTAGARWETAIETGKSRVVPFAAFRYMRVNNGDYTNSHNTRFETKNQNLYIPKVGIAWTGDFVAPNSVCTWRPSVEVGYLWNLGDRSAESNVLVGARMADVGYDIADRNSFYGKAGIELMAKNFTAGVFYRYLKGNAVKNNKWNVNMSWKF